MFMLEEQGQKIRRETMSPERQNKEQWEGSNCGSQQPKGSKRQESRSSGEEL